MVTTRQFETGPRSGLGTGSQGGLATVVGITGQIRSEELDASIREILHDEVAELFREQLLEIFQNGEYVAIAEMVVVVASATEVAAGTRIGQAFQYQDFDNTKPPTFDGIQDPVIAMGWLSDVEGCVFTCSCPTYQKFRCALNMLRSGAKDW